MNRTATILIVDDESNGREVLGALLAPFNYQLLFACDAQQALQLASEYIPDLVLLDVMMPGTDGFEVCRRIRATPALAEVPIILVTALDDRNSRMTGIESGADDFISKPYDRAELRARVNSITRLNRYRRLLEQRSSLEWVVDQAEDAYLIVNAQGQISYANQAARLFLSINTAHPLLNISFLEYTERQYQIEPALPWQEWLHIQSPELVGPRLLIRMATDSAPRCILRADILEQVQGPELRYLIRLREITSMVVEQQLFWTFHSLVRHKLGTALSNMHLSLRAIQQFKLAEQSDESNNLLDIAVRGATMLKATIQDIFHYMDSEDYHKPEQGRCSLSALHLFVDQAMALYSFSGVRIYWGNIDDHQQITLAISRHMLGLIVDELLENACKFHPSHEPLIEIFVNRQDELLQIDICDNGRSLAPEQLARAWQPYFQGERYFTGQVPGLGLGLATVAAVLWRIGGSYRIYNRTAQPGVGVQITIPIAPDPIRSSSLAYERFNEPVLK
jgi:two-component system, cell cycle response regulator